MSLAPYDGLHGCRFQQEDAMPKVIADITMSLDGFVTGAGADEQHGLGDAPELHTWVRQQDAVDTEVLAQATAQSGAVVMGRRLFDLVHGPAGWSKDMGTVPIRRGRRRSSWLLTRRGQTSGWSATWG
jgi:dihydrofolate reductase